MGSRATREPGYRDVLRLPGARRVFSGALLGRLSGATVSLSLLLAVARSTGSYAAAGTAVGAFSLTNVLVSPARARYVDRAGQAAALPRLAGAFAGLLCVLAALTLASRASDAVLVAVAALTGLCPPPLGAAMRGLWASLTRDTALLPKAYSLDAVAEELLFVTGPLLVGLVVAIAPPALALLATAVIAFAGTTVMTRATLPATTQGTPSTAAAARADRPLRQPGFPSLLIALVGLGVVLGTVEVAAPAFAERHGNPAATGLLLAALSLGSVVGGLLYRAWTWQRTLRAQLLVLVTALTIASTALLAAHSLSLLAVLLIVLGLFLAPARVTGYLLSDDLTPLATRTEASTWINTASNAGSAAAAALAGILVEHHGSTTAFAAGAGLVGACSLVAATSHRPGARRN